MLRWSPSHLQLQRARQETQHDRLRRITRSSFRRPIFWPRAVPGHGGDFVNHQATRCILGRSRCGFHPHPNTGDRVVGGDSGQTTDRVAGAKASFLNDHHRPGSWLHSRSPAMSSSHASLAGLSSSGHSTTDRMKLDLGLFRAFVGPNPRLAARLGCKPGACHIRYQIWDRPHPWARSRWRCSRTLRRFGGAAALPGRCPRSGRPSGLASASMNSVSAGYMSIGKRGRGTSCFSEIRLQAEI